MSPARGIRGGRKSLDVMARPGAPPRDVLVGAMRTRPFEDADTAAWACGMLGPDERAMLDRVATAGARAEFMAARVLARTLLAKQVGCGPAEVELRPGAFGRPRAVAPPAARGLGFSLAHADGVALCAVARATTVGADVESVRNLGDDPLGVAGVVCSERELHALRASPPARRAERLLQHWTAKEAIAKAAGLGASLPFSDIEISPRRDGMAYARWGWGACEVRSWWRLSTWRLTTRHFAAVALLLASQGPLAACEVA